MWSYVGRPVIVLMTIFVMMGAFSGDPGWKIILATFTCGIVLWATFADLFRGEIELNERIDKFLDDHKGKEISFCQEIRKIRIYRGEEIEISKDILYCFSLQAGEDSLELTFYNHDPLTPKLLQKLRERCIIKKHVNEELLSSNVAKGTATKKLFIALLILLIATIIFPWIVDIFIGICIIVIAAGIIGYIIYKSKPRKIYTIGILGEEEIEINAYNTVIDIIRADPNILIIQEPMRITEKTHDRYRTMEKVARLLRDNALDTRNPKIAKNCLAALASPFGLLHPQGVENIAVLKQALGDPKFHDWTKSLLASAKLRIAQHIPHADQKMVDAVLVALG